MSIDVLFQSVKKKFWAWLWFAISFISTAEAQKLKASEVPQKVIAAFSYQFPDARRAKWEKQEPFYSADFQFKEEKILARFDEEGTLLSTEKEIPKSALPVEIAESMEYRFPECELLSVRLEESRAHGKRFHLKIKYEQTIKEPVFQLNGKLAE